MNTINLCVGRPRAAVTSARVCHDTYTAKENTIFTYSKLKPHSDRRSLVQIDRDQSQAFASAVVYLHPYAGGGMAIDFQPDLLVALVLRTAYRVDY